MSEDHFNLDSLLHDLGEVVKPSPIPSSGTIQHTIKFMPHPPSKEKSPSQNPKIKFAVEHGDHHNSDYYQSILEQSRFSPNKPNGINNFSDFTHNESKTSPGKHEIKHDEVDDLLENWDSPQISTSKSTSSQAQFKSGNSTNTFGQHKVDKIDTFSPLKSTFDTKNPYSSSSSSHIAHDDSEYNFSSYSGNSNPSNRDKHLSAPLPKTNTLGKQFVTTNDHKQAYSTGGHNGTHQSGPMFSSLTNNNSNNYSNSSIGSNSGGSNAGQSTQFGNINSNNNSNSNNHMPMLGNAHKSKSLDFHPANPHSSSSNHNHSNTSNNTHISATSSYSLPHSTSPSTHSSSNSSNNNTSSTGNTVHSSASKPSLWTPLESGNNNSISSSSSNSIPSISGASSSGMSSSAAKTRCSRVVLGNATMSRGYKNSSFSKNCCDNLICLQCNFKVLSFSNKQWDSTVDYMFFRNNVPNETKLGVKLNSVADSCGYCCQCSWTSVPAADGHTERQLTQGKTDDPQWICAGH